MPSLYGSAGGANRKLRELYARDSGGTTRKLRELWGRDAGGANRKVFSGIDCSISWEDLDDGSVGWSGFEQDGSGQVDLYNRNDMVSEGFTGGVRFYITFNEPIFLDHSQESLAINIVSYSSDHGAGIPYLTLLATDIATGDNHWVTSGETGPRTTGRYTAGGHASSEFYARIFRLDITCDVKYEYAEYKFNWPTGGFSIYGKQINSVELI